ncbi:MAG: Lrp/AsnC family transcriptional regulator [Planctomycetes bacterium]|nr:Lrp/AsnC family transcriptional regulator [Planctomycetota bacterium]
MLDSIDSKALTLLASRARISWADLGEALGLSAPAAAERVHRLEESGVIRGYEARIDPHQVECKLTAFVSVSLGRAKDRPAFLRSVIATAEVLECHHVAGDDDYLLKVRCKDTDALEHLLTGVLKTHAGVVRTRTTIALSTVKESATPPSVAFPVGGRKRARS